MQFTRYDSRGRLLESVGPEGLVSRLEYYDSNAGVLEGMLHKSITDPDGLAIQNAVDLDSLGRVVKAYSSKYFDFTDGRFVTTAAYNELGQTVSTTSTSPFDIVTKRKYNRTGNLIEEITEVKNSENELVQDLFYKSKYKYDEEFNVVESVEGNLNDTQLRKSKYVYDASNKLAITISPAGRKSRVFYNDRYLPQKEVADYGGIGVNSKRFYDADGRVTRLIDPRGGTHRMKYDALGRIIETEDPSGNKSYPTYDKIGNVLTERFFEYINDTTYKLLKRSEYHYNEVGRINVKGANLFEYSNEVVSNPQAAYIESGPGKVLTLSMYYDKAGRLVKTVDQSNRETKHEYDNANRLVKQIDPYGNELSYQYDKAGNVTRMDKREVIRDVVSNEITGNRYFVTKHIYDELNRVTQSIDSLGNKTNFEYDSRGLLEKAIDPLGQVTSSVYDVFRRQLSNSKFLTDKNNPTFKIPVTTSYQYDLDGMLLSQTDALGRITKFEYNGLGRKVSSTLPDGTKDVSDFDFSGMVNSYRDRNGTIIRYTRDVSGRIVRQDIDKSQLPPAINLEGNTFSTFRFDSAGRLIEVANEFSNCAYTYNSLDWLLEENNSANPLLPDFTVLPMKTGRTYNDNGALSVFTYPSGRKLQYQRDVLDRITKIEQLSKGVGYPGDNTTPEQYEIASIQYEGLQRKQLHRNNGSSTEYKYDFGARVVEIKHLMNNTPFMQMQFLYDAVGNMRKKIELADDFQATCLYTYDELYRLNDVAKNDTAVITDLSVLHPYSNAIPEEIPFGQGIIDTLINTLPAEKVYEYDLVGNRLKLEGNNIQVSNYLTNNLDQYTKVDDTSFNYDKNGNLIDDNSFTYQYDYANRLTSVTRKADNTKVLSYLYDTQGRKIFELKDGKIRQMVYNSINAIEEYENSIQDQSLVLDGEIDSLLQLGKSSNDLYLSSDLTKSIRYLHKNNTKENFYVYDEFGKVLQTGQGQVESSYLFHSKKWIPQINKYDFFSRVYDPSIGRFQQRDAKGYVDGTNMYSFVGNNPLVYTDPFGSESRPEHAGVATTLGAETVFRNPKGSGSSATSGSGSIDSAPSGTNYAKEAAKARANYRRNNPMGAGEQVQHWTKEISARNTGMSTEVMNQNLSSLQSRNALPATTLLTDPAGGGTTYSVGGGSTYGNEHKFADRFLIPQIEDQIRLANPNADTRQVCVQAGRQAKWIMTGDPGPEPPNLSAKPPTSYGGVRTGMRYFGYYNLVGGTVSSLFSIGDDIRDGNWIGAGLNTSAYLGGAFEIGGFAASSATLSTWGRFLGAPAAVVGAGFIGVKIGTNLYNNYVDHQHALDVGDAVADYTGSRTLGAVAASADAVQSAIEHMPEAAVDYASETWTYHPSQVDWGRTFSPWRWL